MLFMAAALAQVSEKLDSIQETQEEMFEFLRREKESEQRGDLVTLADTVNGYKHNWDNADYKASKLTLVQSIARKAQQNIVFYRDEARASMRNKTFIPLEKDARSKGAKATESMHNYQLALYIHSFASFVEVLLLGNFSSEYLDSVSAKINSLSLEYRQLYTECYNSLEAASESTLEAGVLSGLAFAGKAIGKAIEKTSIGDKTPIDEVLIDAGDAVQNLRDNLASKPTEQLISTKENVALPFSDAVERISYLYNSDFEILMDAEAIYLLPAEQNQKSD